MTLKELRAALLAAQKRVEDVAGLAEKEKRSLSKEEMETFDTAMGEVDSLKRQLAAKEMEPQKAVHKVSTDQVDSEFRHFLRTGQQRALTGNSNNTDADGKFLNPNAFSNDLFSEITSDGGVLSLMRTIQINSNKLDYPAVDDSLTGTTGKSTKQAAELDTVYERKLTFKNVEITLNQYAIKTVLSNQFRDDTSINIEGEVSRLGAAGIRREASLDAFAVFDAALTIPTHTGPIISYEVLTGLMAQINGEYYKNANFVMSHKHFISILNIKDTAEKPILNAAMEKGLNPTVFGKGIVVDDSAGDNIYFGDFSTAILAQNKNTSTLVDVYSLIDDLATKYVTQARMGAGVLSTKALTAIKLA